jgi:hypothetical protein
MDCSRLRSASLNTGHRILRVVCDVSVHRVGAVEAWSFSRSSGSASALSISKHLRTCSGSNRDKIVRGPHPGLDGVFRGSELVSASGKVYVLNAWRDALLSWCRCIGDGPGVFLMKMLDEDAWTDARRVVAEQGYFGGKPA